MGGMSIWHWLVVLVIVILVFGTKRLTGAGKDLGEAVKGFKKGMADEDEKKPTVLLSDQTPPPAQAPANTEALRPDEDKDHPKHPL